jgi:Rad3-related DNA helicase
MTGRGVRSATDSATTYVLDSNFGRIFRLNRTLFPAWWREAVDRTYSTKELTR